MGNRYFFPSFLFVLLTIIVTFIFVLIIAFAVTHVPFSLAIYLPHFELHLPIDRFSGLAHGQIYDNLFLSVNPQPMIISESNNLPLINNSNTFFTKGLLSTVLTPDPSYLTKNNSELLSQQQPVNLTSNSQNQTVQTDLLYLYPKLVSGSWVLNVSKGLVTDFQANFKILPINGVDKHFVDILNFQNADGSSIIFNQFSNTTINGFADINIDNELFQKDFPMTIQIFKINTITLDVKDEIVDNFFYNSDLLGITDSFKNFKNDELLIFDEENDDEN
ncbi:hypothetical protein [Candidatus Nitrosocosmicus hydrocola]|uniref:hypothetical protein n=1 Tax=Candidatus Nitrosocosmicus hydrocola TaxID=1826872 RepID=UPI00137284A4|nr:hypothetical protein [Candidatus Nitrosocosmicus hydrocola]